MQKKRRKLGNPAPPHPSLPQVAARQVEQFLHRAKGQADPPQEKLAPPPVRTIAPRPAKRPTKQRGNLPQTGPRKVQAPPQPVSRETRKKEGVAEHVTRHLDSNDLSEHAEQLGHTLSQTDERLESRLQAKFGDRANTFQHDPRPADQQEQTLDAQQLFDLLSRPEGMRQAILMHEILRRPTDRW